ncbi:MAG: hypothetical protein ACHP7O_12535, partial [Burkholderiales bacterium]
RLLRSIAGLARAGRDTENEAVKRREVDQARLRSWTLLAQNREMQARVALEPDWHYERDSVTVDMQTWFAQAQEVLFAVNWLHTLLKHTGPKLPDPLVNAFHAFREAAAKRLEKLANEFEQQSSSAQIDSLSAVIAGFDAALAQARDSGAAIPQQIDEIAGAMHAIRERLGQLGRRLQSVQEQA